MSLLKPKELSPEKQDSQEEPRPRPIDSLRDQWLEKMAQKPGAHKKAKTEDPQVKLKKALEKLDRDIEAKEKSHWRPLAMWLQTHQSLDVPGQWKTYVDVKESLAANIEFCFQKAKQVEAKLERSRQRREQIAREGTLGSQPSASTRKSLLQEANISGRTLKLSDGKAAFVGKNARDNLQLLRKSKAWDLWLHIKDQPGCHGILRRNKGQKLSDKELRQVGEWLLKETFGAKAKSRSGLVYEVVVAECRHVRPIKGDKVGRVTYRNEKILPLKLDCD